MALIFRWLVRLFLGLAALALIAGFVLYYVAAGSLPDYDDDVSVRGLARPVEIVRDHSDVPHIFASSDADAFFGLGFVHAQDRLWQMMLLRRTAQGRLSELFGERTLAHDGLMRRLDLYGSAVRSVAVQDAYTTAALKAYADGVNAWLAEVNRGARGRGAPEFFLFTNAMAPWQPADSLAVLKLFAWQATVQAEREVLRARTSLILPAERVGDLLPDMPGPGTAALPPYASLFPDAHLPRYAEAAPWPRPEGGASNAWAAAPGRSATGGTLLASDPHLPFSAPTVWYLARLDLASGGVIGGTIPGIPGILQGRSESFGWGQTASFADDQDLFVEQLNPDNPREVAGVDGFVPLVTRPSIIEIKDAAPVTLRLDWSPNGPVLPPEALAIGTVTPPGHVVALAWTGLSDQDTTMSALLALMRAGSVDEGLAAGAGWVVPAVNVVMADRNRIAQKLFGALPRRDARHQSQGRIPTPGWIVANRWNGTEPFAGNPEFVDPSGGIVGNTNNKVIDRPFPLHVSYDWGDSQRVQRWQRLMQSRQVHTRDSFIEAQLDTVSPAARTLLPLVGADLWFTGEAAPAGTPEALRQQALKLVADWNGEMNEHLPEPLIYAAWMRALQERLIRDELGPLAREFAHLEPLFIERVFTDEGGASAWCDILQSAATETCTDLARMALDDALVWITSHYGSDPASWRWGDAHEAAHDHPVMGQMPLLKYVVNIRQSTSGGDFTLMTGRTSGVGDTPFLNVAGGGYRGVYDFADPDSSVFITATGQSGHPLSRHYDDLSVLWRRGEYIPMSLDPELARAAAVGVTRLTPAP
jgi:penicillin amidase